MLQNTDERYTVISVNEPLAPIAESFMLRPAVNATRQDEMSFESFAVEEPPSIVQLNEEGITENSMFDQVTAELLSLQVAYDALEM